MVFRGVRDYGALSQKSKRRPPRRGGRIEPRALALGLGHAPHTAPQGRKIKACVTTRHRFGSLSIFSHLLTSRATIWTTPPGRWPEHALVSSELSGLSGSIVWVRT